MTILFWDMYYPKIIELIIGLHIIIYVAAHLMIRF